MRTTDSPSKSSGRYSGNSVSKPASDRSSCSIVIWSAREASVRSSRTTRVTGPPVNSRSNAHVGAASSGLGPPPAPISILGIEILVDPFQPLITVPLQIGEV